VTIHGTWPSHDGIIFILSVFVVNNTTISNLLSFLEKLGHYLAIGLTLMNEDTMTVFILSTELNLFSDVDIIRYCEIASTVSWSKV
jgi:hypothetical protein